MMVWFQALPSDVTSDVFVYRRHFGQIQTMPMFTRGTGMGFVLVLQ